MSEQRNDVVDRVRNMLAFAVFGEGSAADGVRDLLAEIERLRCVVECVKADLAYERGKTGVYEAEIERLRSRLAAAERVCEVAAEMHASFIHRTHPGRSCLQSGHIDVGVVREWGETLDAWRAARGGDAR